MASDRRVRPSGPALSGRGYQYPRRRPALVGDEAIPKTCATCDRPALTRGQFSREQKLADGRARSCRMCQATRRRTLVAARRARINIAGQV